MGEKLHEVEKNNMTTSRVIEKLKHNTAYNIKYHLRECMNKGCVACVCQLIHLSGSAQRKTIIFFSLLCFSNPEDTFCCH